MKRAPRADGVLHTMGLLLTQPISPTPWTRPKNLLGAYSSLTIQLLKKDMNHLRVKSKKENAGGTCASAVGFLAHAGGEFATAPLHPLSKP